MAKARKTAAKGGKTSKTRGTEPSEGRDPLAQSISRADKAGDNLHLVRLCKAALREAEATVEAKEAALRLRTALRYDPVALAFSVGGTLLWVALLYTYVLGRG